MTGKSYALYGGKVTLNFNKGSHRYKLIEPLDRAGYKLGVTSVLKILNKPELLQWAANKAVDTFIEAYKSKPWTEAEFKELCKKAKYAHSTYKDARAEVGKNVHTWIENHIKGIDTPPDPLMEPSISAYLRWEYDFKPEYYNSECVLYSRKYDYCGTMDASAVIGGLNTIIDFKTGEPEKEYDVRKRSYTGRNRGRLEHFIQEGGYSIALREEQGWLPEQLITLYLTPEGNMWSFSTKEVDMYEELFLSILQTYRQLQSAIQFNNFKEMDA